MKFKRVEIALLLSLALTLLVTAALSRRQDELSDKLIRLHVVANSDEDYDQELKLRVRDAVLSSLEPALQFATSRGHGIKIIGDNLAVALDAAEREIASSGYGYAVSAALTRETFPTRVYETFTLPAGEYETLRVVIGDGAGRNWWCVIYPPLCTDAVTAELALEEAELSGNEVKLIEGGTETKIAIRFRVLEVVSKLRKLLRLK